MQKMTDSNATSCGLWSSVRRVTKYELYDVTYTYLLLEQKIYAGALIFLPNRA